MIINTHAPGVVQLCDPADLLLADSRAAPDAEWDHHLGIVTAPVPGFVARNSGTGDVLGGVMARVCAGMDLLGEPADIIVVHGDREVG